MPVREDNIDKYIVQTVFSDKGVAQGFSIIEKKQEAVIKNNDKISKSNNRVSSSFKKVEKSGFSLARGLRALGVAIGLNQVIKYADEWTNISNIVSNLTENDKERLSLQNKLFDVAKKTRSSVDGTAKIYAGLSSSGLDAQQRINATEIISKALKVTGSDESTANAISKVLKTGRLKTLLGINQGFAEIIASGMSMSLEELQYRMKRSGLTAQQVLQALSNKSADIDKSFKKTKTTFSEAMAGIKTSVVRLIGTFEETTGFFSNLTGNIDSVSDGLVWVSKNFKTFIGIIAGATSIGGLVTLIKNFDLVRLNLKDGIGLFKSLKYAMADSGISKFTKASWALVAPWAKLLIAFELVDQAIKMLKGDWNIFAEAIDSLTRGTQQALNWIGKKTGWWKERKATGFYEDIATGKTNEFQRESNQHVVLDLESPYKSAVNWKSPFEQIKEAPISQISNNNQTANNKTANVNQNINITINESKNPAGTSDAVINAIVNGINMGVLAQ